MTYVPTTNAPARNANVEAYINPNPNPNPALNQKPNHTPQSNFVSVYGRLGQPLRATWLAFTYFCVCAHYARRHVALYATRKRAKFPRFRFSVHE